MFRDLASILAAVLAIPFASSDLLAQDRWGFESDLGATIDFGASEQYVVRTDGELARDAETWIASFDYAFDYGESAKPGEESFVSKRSWSAGMSLDLFERSRVSPFAFVNSGGSFEKSIDLRIRSGAGARYRFLNPDGSRDDVRLDMSLAALVDWTDPRATEDGDSEPTRTARLSGRLRALRELESGVRFSLTTFYQPSLEDFDDYLVDVAASVAYPLGERLALSVSFLDQYDSRAVDRGAPENNEGTVIVGLALEL